MAIQRTDSFRAAVWFTAILACGLLAGQSTKNPKQEQKTAKDQEAIPHFDAPVTNILAPVRVMDRRGTFITGITAEEFDLRDNGVRQAIQVDESLIPISLVIAIQCNNEVDAILPKVNRIGNMVAPLLLGEQGEAAVIAFDSRVRTMTDFTSDPDRITNAVAKIHGGSMSARLVDAVDAAEHMLRSRPKNRQRVVLLISETRDSGSELRGRETLNYLQANNVTVYQVTMSRVLGKLTAPAKEPAPDTLPPAMHPMPSNTPATPTNVAQTYGTGGYGVDFVPVVSEIFNNVKYIFKVPAAQVFTLGTGGSKYDFKSGKSLEDAIQEMSAELHLQYAVSYNPNNKDQAGWHDIVVEVAGHGKVQVKTRPGYWMTASVEK